MLQRSLLLSDLCGQESLNTEFTEALSDLCVEALEAQRKRRGSFLITGRLQNASGAW